MRWLAVIFCLGMGVSFGQDLSNKIPVDSGRYHALINLKGERITDWMRYDEVRTDHLNSQFQVKRMGKWGIADTNLREILPTEYVAFHFIGKYLLAEKINELVIFNEQLDSIRTIPEIIRLEIPGEKGYSFRRNQELYEAYKVIVKTKNGTGILDHEFNWMIEPTYDEAFYLDGIIYTRKGNSFGFIGYNGLKGIVEPQWNSIGRFNDNVIEVSDATGHRRYFEKSGDIIPDSDSTLVFDAMSRIYKVYKNGKAELYAEHKLNKVIEYSGEDIFVIKKPYLSYEYSDYVSKGSYEFAVKHNGKIGVIDQNGKTIISANYDNITDGGPGFYIFMRDGKFGVINSSEQEVLPPVYTFIQRESDFFRLYNYNKKGIADLTGKTIVPIEYTEITVRHTGFLTKRGSRHGFHTPDGQLVLQPEYTSIFTHNGGLEYVSETGRCMVDKHGLITPLNCKKITRSNNKVKYYTNGQIYLHHIEDGKVVDTTIYPYDKSVEVQDRNWNSRPLNLNEHEFTTFTDQLTGKIGSIAQEADGWGVQPMFFNIHSVNGHMMARWPMKDLIEIGDRLISVKEVLIPFYGSAGSISDHLFAYLAPGQFSGWHSSDLDPCIKKDKTWNYYSRNIYRPADPSIILKREAFNSIALKSGEVNFSSGQDLIKFKDLYNDMNSGWNLHISTAFEFNRLAQNPMVKIKDPEWQVLTCFDDNTYKKIGDFDVYQLLPSGNAIFKRKNGGYGIMERGENELLAGTAQLIELIEEEEYEFYKVKISTEDISGISETKWTIWNYSSQILPDSYEEVEVINKDLFKVTDLGESKLIDTSGNIIYHYR